MNLEQKRYILKNYNKIGCKKCAEILYIKKTTIASFASKNKLKVNKKTIVKISSERSKLNWNNHIFKDEDYKVNPLYFINCKTPESSYILGLLWADGTVYKKNYYNTISIECLESDMIEFKKYFKKSGNWSEYKREGRISGKTMITLRTNNKKLVDFLFTNNYNKKSYISPNKILSLIPDELKLYFFRGWIDGDGCFYINKKNNCTQFYLSGSFKQDWTAIENLLTMLNIDYKINRIKNKNNTSYSSIRITNRKKINMLGNYIYQNFNEDNIGLDRKYKKYIDIINL